MSPVKLWLRHRVLSDEATITIEYFQAVHLHCLGYNVAQSIPYDSSTIEEELFVLEKRVTVWCSSLLCDGHHVIRLLFLT